MFPYSEALKSVSFLKIILSDCTDIRLVRLRGLLSAVQQRLYMENFLRPPVVLWL